MQHLVFIPRMLMNIKRIFFLLIFSCSLFCFASAAHAETTKIIFLAGPKDHGKPGRHEYEKDLRLLASCLETAQGLGTIETEVYVGAIPHDLSIFEGASTIVINSSSDRIEGETHPLFPPNPSTNGRGYDSETSKFLNDLDALIKKNQIGVVVFHYANWAENWRARGLYMDWIGGLWVQMVSRNPKDDWTMTPFPTYGKKPHPILNGVNSWTYYDEIFCRFHLPNDSRRTNLLIGSSREDKLGIGPQTTSWAYQRDDGGRGFAYGGVDFYKNWKIEDYRRFILNGIAWSAGIELPETGIQSTLTEDNE